MSLLKVENSNSMDFLIAEVIRRQGWQNWKRIELDHILIKLIPSQQLQLMEKHSCLCELNHLPYRFLKYMGQKLKNCNTTPFSFLNSCLNCISYSRFSIRTLQNIHLFKIFEENIDLHFFLIILLLFVVCHWSLT